MQAYFRCLRPLCRLRVIIGLVLRVSALLREFAGMATRPCPLDD